MFSKDVLYRLGRMQTRVKNILDGQVRIGHIDELQRMMERLNEILQTFDMHTMNPRILMTAYPIKQEIQTLLEIGVDEDEGEEEYISHLEYEE